MATEFEIGRLRRATDTAEDDEIYTENLLEQFIDQLGFETAAATIWKEKAAAAAGLVDTTESGSTRRLSDLHKNYLAMGSAVGGVVQEPETGGGSYTVEIERV